MKYEISLNKIPFESLHVSLSNDLKNGEIYNLQERSKTSVTSYRFDLDTSSFIMTVDFEYSAHAKENDEEPPKQMSNITAQFTAYLTTDALHSGLTEQEADTLMTSIILHEAYNLCETAIHSKIKNLMRDFDLNTRLPMGRVFFEA